MLQTSGQHAQEIISFGPFRLYPSERVLKKGDQPVKLGSRAFDILLMLVQQAGEVVGHKELVAKVWPGVFVEEVSLRVHIAALRKALDTGEAGMRYLTNVAGRGYCFVAPTSREWVELIDPVADASFDALYQLPPALARMVGREETVREICQKLIAARFADGIPRCRLLCGTRSAQRSATPGGHCGFRVRSAGSVPGSHSGSCCPPAWQAHPAHP